MVLRRKWAPPAAVAVVLALAVPAQALAVDGTASISGATSTSVTATDAPAVSATLNGTDQEVSDGFDITVEDSRGTGAGWNLSIASTAFTDGAKSLAADAAAITDVTAACVNGATCTDPTSSVPYPLTLSSSADKLYSAAADTGLGKFTVTPTLRVAVPANTYAGSYTSTITITSAETP
jgi:hypothetical protein